MMHACATRVCMRSHCVRSIALFHRNPYVNLCSGSSEGGGGLIWVY